MSAAVRTTVIGPRPYRLQGVASTQLDAHAARASEGRDRHELARRLWLRGERNGDGNGDVERRASREVRRVAGGPVAPARDDPAALDPLRRRRLDVDG